MDDFSGLEELPLRALVKVAGRCAERVNRWFLIGRDDDAALLRTNAEEVIREMNRIAEGVDASEFDDAIESLRKREGLRKQEDDLKKVTSAALNALVNAGTVAEKTIEYVATLDSGTYQFLLGSTSPPLTPASSDLILNAMRGAAAATCNAVFLDGADSAKVHEQIQADIDKLKQAKLGEFGRLGRATSMPFAPITPRPPSLPDPQP